MDFADIEYVKKLDLNETDILVVSVKRGNMPFPVWSKYVGDIRESLALLLLTNRILIIDGDSIDFTVIKEIKNGASAST